MVAMEIVVTGPREGLTDWMMCLWHCVEALTSRGRAVCTPASGLCTTRQQGASLMMSVAGRNFPLLCFYALNTLVRAWLHTEIS